VSGGRDPGHGVREAKPPLKSLFRGSEGQSPPEAGTLLAFGR